MAKKYEIELNVNTTQSDAASARAARAAEKIETAHKKAVDAQENAAKRSTAAQEKAAQKTADTAEREAKRAVDASIRESRRRAKQVVADAEREVKAKDKLTDQATSKAERAAKKVADTAEKEAKRTADAQVRETQRAEDQKARVAQRAQDRLTAMGGKLLTDEELRAKGQAAIYDRLNDKKIAAAVKFAEKERVAGLSVRDRLKEGFESFTSSINPAALAMTAGVAAIGFAVKALADDWRLVAKGIEDSIKFTNKYRESLPENAALKGHLGDTTIEAKENLLLRSKTLQNFEQSKAFEGGMLNTGNVSIGTAIDQKEFDKFKVAAGSFQAAEGGDATTHGELAGQLPSLMKKRKDAQGKMVPVTADEAIAEESKLFDILSLGGSTFSSGVGQLLKNSSLSATGLYNSIDEQAALQAMFSVKSPQSAGDLTNQFTRATVGGLGRMRGVQIEGAEKIGPYLKSLGANNQMTPIDIGKLISEDMTRQEREDNAKGLKFVGFDYLKHKGYGNQDETNVMLQFHAANQSGELKKFEEAAAKAPNSNSIQNKIAASRADPLMQNRSRELSNELTQFTFDRSFATADAYRRQIFDLLKTEDSSNVIAGGKRASGNYDDMTNQSIFGLRSTPQTIQSRANEKLQDAAKRAGIEIGDLGRYNPFESQAAIDKRYQEAIDKITAAGVDPFADLRGDLTAAAQGNLEKSEAAEAGPRAGLANRAALQRSGFRSTLPARPRFSGSGPSLLAPIPGDANQALSGMMAQLLNLTATSIQVQRDQTAQLVEANRRAARPQAVPPPLPIQGPGRIPTR